MVNNSIFIPQPKASPGVDLRVFAGDSFSSLRRREPSAFLGGGGGSTEINLVVITRLRFPFASFHFSLVIAGKGIRRTSNTVRIALGFLNQRRTRT